MSIFQKNSFFIPVAIREKMVQLYSHDLLCGNFFEMTKHDGIQYIKGILVNFSKKYPSGEVTRTQFGPNSCSLLSYDLLNMDFLKCSMKVYSRYITVTVSFAKISLLGQNEQFRPNLGKNYASLFCNLDLDLRIF